MAFVFVLTGGGPSDGLSWISTHPTPAEVVWVSDTDPMPYEIHVSAGGQVVDATDGLTSIPLSTYRRSGVDGDRAVYTYHPQALTSV